MLKSGRRRKRLGWGAILCLGVILLSPGASYGVKWVYVCESSNGKEYVDAESVENDKEQNSLKIWVKRIYDRTKAQRIKEQLGITSSKDLAYSVALYNIDYKEKKFKALVSSHFDPGGNLLSEDKAKEKEYIIPGSVMDRLVTKCAGMK